MTKKENFFQKYIENIFERVYNKLKSEIRGVV